MDLIEIIGHFFCTNSLIDIVPFGRGHINDTHAAAFRQPDGSERRYILQRINRFVFKDPEALMENVERVTRHLHSKIVSAGGDPLRETLILVPALDGRSFYRDPEGEYWRVALADDSRKLAVMGARTILDIVMTQKVGRLRTFQSRLKALEAKGFIGKANREILRAALEARGAPAQRAYAPTSDIVNEVMDIIENLLQAVYIFPKSLKKIKRTTARRAVRKTRKTTR